MKRSIILRSLVLIGLGHAACSAEPAKLPRPAHPLALPASWIEDSDYPDAAIRANEQGTVSFQLAVDATGAVTGCTVTATSGSAALDEATCRVMRERGRFEPALDRDGKAIASLWPSRLRWVLPNGALEGPQGQLGLTLFTIDLAADGKVLRCAGVTETKAPVDCKLGGEPPPWSVRLAASYQTLRLKTGIQRLESASVEPGADWGQPIARRWSIMTYPSTGGQMSECRVSAAEGEPLLGRDLCASNKVQPVESAGPTIKMMGGWALYGVPR